MISTRLIATLRTCPSSSRATMPRCTSSGPSASRSARAAVHAPASGKSSDSPPPPWIWIAMSITCCAMVGHGHLDLGDLGQRVQRAADVELPGRVQHQQPGLVDRDPGVGDPLAVAAEVGDRLAERGALQRAGAGLLQRQLREADQPHAVVHASRSEPALGDRERLAGPADDVRGRHADVGEGHLAVAERLVVHPHRREHALDLHARSVLRHQHHRVAVVAVRVGIASAP